MAPDELTNRPVLGSEELEQRVRDLEQQLRQRDEFLSVVGHELRNPVSPLYMQVAVLTERIAAATAPIEKAWLCEELNKITGRLDRFIASLNRLLDVSQISEGTFTLVPGPCDLVEVVRTSIESFAEVRKLQISVTVHGAPSVAGHWDRLRLEQIVGNLLSNAIRYGVGRPITITVDVVEGCARLQITDRGIGIAPHELATVFDRFRRGSNARRASGFGVGLWVVAELCRAMGGTIDVTSELGQGSTFTVLLPRGDER